jgi:hypothetical protein
MTVSDISMWWEHWFSRYHYIYITVTVVDEGSNAPVASAEVSLTLTTPSGTVMSGSASTGSDGKVTFRGRSREHGTYTANVTNVTKSGYTYHPTVTSQTLLVPSH